MVKRLVKIGTSDSLYIQQPNWRTQVDKVEQELYYWRTNTLYEMYQDRDRVSASNGINIRNSM